MGQHKEQREPSFKAELLYTLAGAAMTAVAILRFKYLPPKGYFPAKNTAGLLLFGVVFMLTPLWSYLRRRKRSGTPD